MLYIQMSLELLHLHIERTLGDMNSDASSQTYQSILMPIVTAFKGLKSDKLMSMPTLGTNKFIGVVLYT